MKRKIIIAIATLLACGQGAWADGTPHFSGTINASEDIPMQNGTKDHPYLISSVTDLNYLAEDVNNHVITKQVKNDKGEVTATYYGYETTYFKLANNIGYSNVDLDEDGTVDSNFTPIGIMEEYNGSFIPDKGFKGIFDGGNNTISGITVNSNGGVAIGLFGNACYPAVIKNVKIANSSFTGNFCVGAIAGILNGTTNHDVEWGIYNCEVKNDVTVTAASYYEGEDKINGWYAGGIVGDLSVALASECISAATVSGDEYIGGIAGSISNSGSSYYGTLTDCFYTGSSVSGAEDAEYVGTVVGLNGLTDNDGKFKENSEGTINLTLYDDDSEATVKNATRLSNYNRLKANVTLSGRTLYKDGSWNTLCLPFDVALSGDFGNADVRTLSDATFSGGTLTLSFTDKGTFTSIEAGKPYIIRWESSSGTFTPTTFTGVTINNATTDVEKTAANFHGIYSPYSTGGEDRTKLYLGYDNTDRKSKLYYPNATMTIGAFRAYFTLNNITAVEEGSNARSFVLNFGDEDTSGIVDAEANPSLFTLHSSLSAWYTLDGRRLSGKPAASGLYISNGRKVYVK